MTNSFKHFDSKNIFKFYLTFIVMMITSSQHVLSDPMSNSSNPVSEGELESNTLEIVQSDSTASNSSLGYRFQCVVKGLNDEELAKLTSALADELVDDIIINLYEADEVNSSKKYQGSRPTNLHFNVTNNTLLITGDIFSDTENENRSDVPLSISKCDIVFPDRQDTLERTLGRDQFPSSPSHNYGGPTPPRIKSDYSHVVLVKGATDQVISCISEGNPPPRIRWRKEGENELTGTSLSKDNHDIFQGPTRKSYLLFPKVDMDAAGNFTCIAENSVGRATRTFEVDVISTEDFNLDEGEDDDDNDQSFNGPNFGGSKFIWAYLRSKRDSFWRAKKIYVPISRPHSRYPGSDSRSGESGSYEEDDEQNREMQILVNLIAERLKLARKVAIYKWDNNVPVEDREREEIILENMIRQAENRGLSSSWAKKFFRDQIEGNKDIQYELLRKWQHRGRRPPGPPVDLSNDVRPRIDSINCKLLELSKRTEYSRKHWKCRQGVERNARFAAFLYDFDDLHKKALERATHNLCIVHRSRSSDYHFDRYGSRSHSPHFPPVSSEEDYPPSLYYDRK